MIGDSSLVRHFAEFNYQRLFVVQSQQRYHLFYTNTKKQLIQLLLIETQKIFHTLRCCSCPFDFLSRKKVKHKKLKLKRYEVRSALPELFSSNAATPKLGAHVTCMHSLHSKCRERKKEGCCTFSGF